MAGTGDTLAFPDGSDYTITTSAGESSGSLVEMEILLPANAVTPPLHVHPKQEEDFEVLSGALDVHFEGQWMRLPEGESMTIRRGEPHAFRNSSGLRVRVRNVHRPALGYQDYLEELHSLTQEGKIRSFSDASSLLQLARLFEKYEDTIVPAKRGQRAVMGLFARVGRRKP
jgi:mannose-6-phosphate isomerase-like protein (cupin superfamily)